MASRAHLVRHEFVKVEVYADPGGVGDLVLCEFLLLLLLAVRRGVCRFLDDAALDQVADLLLLLFALVLFCGAAGELVGLPGLLAALALEGRFGHRGSRFFGGGCGRGSGCGHVGWYARLLHGSRPSSSIASVSRERKRFASALQRKRKK